jgi:hypothetical protein
MSNKLVLIVGTYKESEVIEREANKLAENGEGFNIVQFDPCVPDAQNEELAARIISEITNPVAGITDLFMTSEVFDSEPGERIKMMFDDPSRVLNIGTTALTQQIGVHKDLQEPYL